MLPSALLPASEESDSLMQERETGRERETDRLTLPSALLPASEQLDTLMWGAERERERQAERERERERERLTLLSAPLPASEESDTLTRFRRFLPFPFLRDFASESVSCKKCEKNSPCVDLLQQARCVSAKAERPHHVIDLVPSGQGGVPAKVGGGRKSGGGKGWERRQRGPNLCSVRNMCINANNQVRVGENLCQKSPSPTGKRKPESKYFAALSILGGWGLTLFWGGGIHRGGGGLCNIHGPCKHQIIPCFGRQVFFLSCSQFFLLFPVLLP